MFAKSINPDKAPPVCLIVLQFVKFCVTCRLQYILRGKSLAIYFEDSQFRRNRTRGLPVGFLLLRYSV